MVEFVLLCTQTDFDVAQTFAVGQLSKCHAQILIQSAKVFDSVVALITLNTASERMHGQVLDDL